MEDGTETTPTVYINCVDTLQYSFASHLSMELRRKGISTIFVNSNGALDVIEEVSAWVVVFSKDCLSSASYMDKLVTVLQCQREKKMLVLPVFYGISPSDIVVVPEEHGSDDRIREWSSALKKLRKLPLHQSREGCDDSELVDEIVKTVYEKLFPTKKIGINSRMLEFENLVRKQPWGIRRIGMWGMPGIGMTTLAKAVFDQISRSYETSCFIKHFDEAFHEKGIHSLLEEHFGKTLKELLRIPSDKLNKKRTLVVLDDVQNASAAESFLRGIHWFSPGSLIIVTSRDKQVYRHCQINHVYEVQSLNEKESLQLFSQCAFGNDTRYQELLELSMEVIDYASGNPFALSYYGKELQGKKLSDTKTTFLELKRRTQDKIHDLFRRSYEALNDKEKNIFLDIACFFNGENVDYVMHLLEGCGFLPHAGIDVLVEKSLVTILDKRVKMHNLIQDFGREIISERLSRLWEPWSIKSLLENDEFKEERALGTEDIEGIFLDASKLSFDVKSSAFEDMLSLRFLKIYYSSYEKDSGVVRLPKGLESLPNELRLLHWEKYPLQSLPQDFEPCHLVELNLSYSQLHKLWEGTKNLKMLKMVKVCHSQQLTEIDDICKAQNIEKIDLQGCTKLQRFPATDHLQHLRVVNLSDCKEITNLPEVSSNIQELHLEGTSITELPLSIVSLFKQAKFNRELSDFLTKHSDVSNALQDSLVRHVSSNHHLGKLVFLNMKYCSHLKSLPQMVDIDSLQVLDLSGCSELEFIRGLPCSLKELYVNGTGIEKLPQLPLSLEILNAHGCVCLISIPYDFKRLPRYYTFTNCFDVSAYKVSKFVENALDNVERIARECQQELSKSLAFSFTVPSPTSTYFTSDLQPGSSVMIQLNSSTRNTLGFAIFVQVSFSEDYHEASGFGVSCVCRWKDNKCVSHWMEKSFHCWTPEEGLQMDHTFVFCDFNMHLRTCEENDDPSILAGLLVFEFYTLNKQKKIIDESCTVKKCGVRVFTAASEEDDASSNITRPLPSPNHQQKLFYQDVEQVLKVIYDDLDVDNRNVFNYITSLFNEEDDDFLAALIASIGVRISSVFGVLASKYLIHMSPLGIFMLHGLLQEISTEIAHTQSLDMASSSCIWKYHIFTSFSEEDDCSNKISHLLSELQCKMKRSKSVGSELVKEIRESKGLIVVLSKNYASSSRCLDELVEIMKSMEEFAQMVVPIFYNVVPSDVRQQTGDFGRVFKNTCKGKSKDEKQKWVQALTDVTDLVGMDARKRDNEGNMKKNLRHPQTRPWTEAWAWGLGRACKFTGSFFTKKSLPTLLVTTVYKPWQSSRSILIRVGFAHSFKIIQSTMGQILGVEYSSEGEIVPGTSPFTELWGLAEDCIFQIITFTSPRDAWNAASVSKSFKSAVKDDRVWEKFIPSDYSSLIPRPLDFSSKQNVYSYLCDHFLIEDGKKSFWLEKESGKRCFMISARELSITWGNNPMYWRWISIPEARFKEVPELLTVCWFNIFASTNSRLLSPGTRYSAYIVFQTNDEFYGFRNIPVKAKLNLVGKESSKRFIYFDAGSTDGRSETEDRYVKKPEWREDGWMEAELGEFFNEDSCDEIKLRLKEIYYLNWKGGLIIQGVEFRPQRLTISCDVRNDSGLCLSASDSSMSWL